MDRASLSLLSLNRRCRGVVRHAALEAACVAQQGLGAAVFDPSPRVHFLLLHEITPEESAPFERLLATLSRRFEFVPYGEAVRRALAGPVDRPLLAISFDDGLASCAVAARALDAHGVQACFFVCPWAADSPDEGSLARFCREKLWHGPKPFLNWRGIERLRDAGHEIGGHTLTHPNLAQLSPQRRRDEIADCREQLVRRLGRCDHFAWPYGRFEHLPASAVAEVFKAGFDSCASGERGCHAPASFSGQETGSPYAGCLRRESIRAAWPIRHIAYFLNRSAAAPLPLARRWQTPCSLRAA